jgi:hypothetical protein
MSQPAPLCKTLVVLRRAGPFSHFGAMPEHYQLLESRGTLEAKIGGKHVPLRFDVPLPLGRALGLMFRRAIEE